jgi:4'-phosphopantetheinyl transferase
LAEGADVEVWTFGLDLPETERERLRALLDPQETARADRLLKPEHAARFMVAHGRTRQILGAASGRDPARLAYSAGPFGKPAVSGGEIEFSLTHSGALAVLAVARFPVGVDIEAQRDLERPGVSRFFSAAEQAQLAELDAEAWRPALLRCWTRKEAVAKALGRGLHLGFDRFSVTFLEDDPPALNWLDDDVEAPTTWRVRDLQTPPGYVGALAAGRSDLRIRYRPG